MEQQNARKKAIRIKIVSMGDAEVGKVRVWSIWLSCRYGIECEICGGLDSQYVYFVVLELYYQEILWEEICKQVPSNDRYWLWGN